MTPTKKRHLSCKITKSLRGKPYKNSKKLTFFNHTHHFVKSEFTKLHVTSAQLLNIFISYIRKKS